MAEQTSLERIAVGDHVRLKTFLANQHQTYQATNIQFAFRRDAVNGLVVSIRDVKSGQLVAETTGSPEGYVFELLFDNTFNSRFASARNAPRGAERATAAPAWRRIQAALRDLAGKGELISTTAPDFLKESPLAKLLDGWKIVKIHSNDVVSLEEQGNGQDAE